MKSFIYLSLFFLLFTSSAQAITLANAYKGLQGYAASDLQINARNSKAQVYKKIGEIIDLINESVEAALAGKEKVTPEYLKEVVRVVVITFEVDPSLSAAQSLFPLYKEHKDAVEGAIKSLPAKDAEHLNKAIRDLIREEAEGNG